MAIIPIPEGLDSKLCVLGEGVLADVPDVLKKLWHGEQPIIVADENTWAAAGKQVMDNIVAAGFKPAEPKIFPANPVMHADYKYIPALAELLKGKLPIAVGSGTINDLVKRSHFEAGCPGYLCVATACSVDGYTSYGAAITVDGFKKTLPCSAPLAVLADSKVLSSAPIDMTASGYADLAAKIVAGADWYIADALGINPIDAKTWAMVQLQLRDWLKDPEGIRDGKAEPLAGLFNGLAATGFAMQYYRESRPASGAEHLFSHAWEMDNLMVNGVNPSHGFKVAIGTLISTLLMEEALKWDVEKVKQLCAAAPEVSLEERRAEVDKHLKGTQIYDSVMEVCIGKLKTGDALKERRAKIVEVWDQMRANMRKQLFTYEDMVRRFKVLGCPVLPEEIGLDEPEVRRGVFVASLIRNRYTILDLLFELGALESTYESIIPKLFGK